MQAWRWIVRPNQFVHALPCFLWITNSMKNMLSFHPGMPVVPSPQLPFINGASGIFRPTFNDLISCQTLSNSCFSPDLFSTSLPAALDSRNHQSNIFCSQATTSFVVPTSQTKNSSNVSDDDMALRKFNDCFAEGLTTSQPGPNSRENNRLAHYGYITDLPGPTVPIFWVSGCTIV